MEKKVRVQVMKLEDINENTKIKELSKEYPWLIDEVKKLSDRAANLSSTLIRIILARATLKDIAEKVDEPSDKLIEQLKELIISHEGTKQ
jgi:hypothetical protein